MSSREDKVYARCFKRKAYGHALFKEVSAKSLRPGTCGYFDFDGDWHPLLHLIPDDPPAPVEEPADESTSGTTLSLPAVKGFLSTLFKQKEDTTAEDEAVEGSTSEEVPGTAPLPAIKDLTALPELLHDSRPIGTWGAIVSEGVEGSQMDFTVEGKAPDGTGAGIGWKYTSSRSDSAILATDGKITHEQTWETDKIRAWVYENIETIIEGSSASAVIRKKGLWVVTKTYLAKRAAIALLRSKDSNTYFGVRAATHGVEVSPSAQWWNGYKDSSWHDLGDGKNDVVLFMSGIWWTANPLNPFSKKFKHYEKRKDQHFLDAHDGVVPRTIEFRDKEQPEKYEYVEFMPRAVGKDPSFKGIPEAKRSPLYDAGDQKGEDDSSDESDEEEEQEESEDEEENEDESEGESEDKNNGGG